MGRNVTDTTLNPALRKAPLKKFTRAGLHKAKSVSKDMADLELQLKFCKMKFNKWSDLDNYKWVHLKDFHATKQAEISQYEGA